MFMLKSHVRALLALGTFIGAASALAQSRPESADETIQLETDSFSLDRKANVTTFVGLRIEAGHWNLVADRASARSDALDFKSGEWRFEGNVRVAIGAALVTAEGAIFAFSEQELVRGELWGTPVAFEDNTPEQEGPVVGQAERLRYDDRAGTVELLGEVTLSVGPYQTTGCDLVYFLGSERFTTGSEECSEPFRTRIPRERIPGADDEAAPEP